MRSVKMPQHGHGIILTSYICLMRFTTCTLELTVMLAYFDSEALPLPSLSDEQIVTWWLSGFSMLNEPLTKPDIHFRLSYHRTNTVQLISPI